MYEEITLPVSEMKVTLRKGISWAGYKRIERIMTGAVKVTMKINGEDNGQEGEVDSLAVVNQRNEIVKSLVTRAEDKNGKEVQLIPLMDTEEFDAIDGKTLEDKCLELYEEIKKKFPVTEK